MTLSEKQPSLDALYATRQQLQEIIGGLTPAQWHFRTAEDQWSVAELAEHIVVVEKRVMGALKPNEGGTSLKRDSTITRVVPDRRTKIAAPDPVRPKGRYQTAAEWLETFAQVRAHTIHWLETTEDPRAVALDHFVFGPLDGYQWSLFASAHLQRHLEQLGEIMKHPNFPA
ncbi:MAG: DinB family protein [Acidobacteria bacterium]|nr:DinB family protein [Acidobacteriota bacterium]